MVSLIIATVIRLINLYRGKSLWSDEQFTLELAQVPFWECYVRTVQDVHQPLYFLLTNISYHALPSELGLRLTSILAGIGVVYYIYRLLCDAIGHRWALFGSLLAGISPYFLQQSNEARVYSLTAFLTIGSMYYLTKYLESYETKKLVIFLTYMVLGLLTNHYVWFWFVAVTLYTLKKYMFNPRMDLLLISLLVMWVMTLPLLGMTIYQAMYNEHMFSGYRVAEYMNVPMLLKKIVAIPMHLVGGYQYSMITFREALSLWNSPLFLWQILAGFLALYLVLESRLRLFTGLIVIPTLFLLICYPIRLDARYLAYISPIYYVCLTIGIYYQDRLMRKVAIGILVPIMVYGMLYTLALKTDPMHREDIKGMVEHVREHIDYETDKVEGYEPLADLYKLKLGYRDERIWTLSGVNMHSDVAARQIENQHATMKARGYESDMEPLPFGELSMLYRHRRRE